MPVLIATFLDDNGRADRTALLQHGPTVDILVAPFSRYFTGALQGPTFGALTDTGFAEGLDLPVVDAVEVAAWAGAHTISDYGAVVLIPRLPIHRCGSFIGIDSAFGETPHGVVLGRRFLENVIMIYDGMRAQITFASPPDHDSSSTVPRARPTILPRNRDDRKTHAMRIGVLIIGSLYWDDKPPRDVWRAERLDLFRRQNVRAPICYGRRSRSRGETYTMVFSLGLGVEDFGNAIAIPCRSHNPVEEAEWLWAAETGPKDGPMSRAERNQTKGRSKTLPPRVWGGRRDGQARVWPPSMKRFWPVMWEAASLTRKAMAAAWSAG